MAANPIYKIEKNVPIIRRSGHGFDKTQPEYIVMMKMKVGDSFEFPRERVNYVHNTRVYLRRESGFSFHSTSRETIEKNPKMLTGRCWKLENGTGRKYTKKSL